MTKDIPSADVDELASWLHRNVGPQLSTWPKLTTAQKHRMQGLARKLLAGPPPVLVRYAKEIA